jgi:hypothetical protein
MPFCPKCRYEYKPEIGECPDCGVRLVERLEDEKSEENIEEELSQKMDFVPFKTLPTKIQADMLQEALENEGIVSTTKGDPNHALRYFRSFSPLLSGGITIWVSEKDLPKAREIAEQMFGDA